MAFLPEQTVIRAMKACVQESLPTTTHGAGTANCGQVVPLSGSVLLALADCILFEMVRTCGAELH